MTPELLTHQELADWFTTKVARTLGLTPNSIDVEMPLADYGIDSAASLMLCADLEAEKGIAVETTTIWDYATIDAIAAHLASEERTS